MTVSVHVSHAAQPAVDEVVATLVDDLVASRVTAADSDLWGPDAAAEAAVRLGWVEAVSNSRPLVAESTASSSRAWADPRSPPRSSPTLRACR